MNLFEKPKSEISPLTGLIMGDQVVNVPKITTPVEISIQGGKVLIKSVSAFMLELIERHVVSCMIEHAKEKANALNLIKELKKELKEQSQALAEKKNLKEKMAVVTEIENLAEKSIEKEVKIKASDVIRDTENIVPIIQLIYLNNLDPNWVDKYEGWPPDDVLELAIPKKTIMKRHSTKENELILDVFEQKNDTAKTRGIFFRMANLASPTVSTESENTSTD